MDMISLSGFTRSLPPIAPRELVGLWKGHGIPTGHPFDGVLENLSWFGKRFTPDMRVDALPFRSGDRRLVAIDPKWIPLRLALRFHEVGRMRVARNLFSYLQRRLRAKGPVASLKTMVFGGVESAAMVYDHPADRRPLPADPCGQDHGRDDHQE